VKSPLLNVDLGAAQAMGLGPAWLLLDCPEGTWASWTRHGLRPTGPDAIAFTGGTARHIAGLYGLLAGLALAGRRDELRLLHSVHEESVGNLVAAYLQSEEPTYPIALEADWPGAVLMVGGLRLQSHAREDGLRWTVQGGGRTLERLP
jgi:ribonuclease BN (tRNA processing enzyme)